MAKRLNMQKAWITLVLKELENQRIGLHKRDISFYQLDRLTRIIERTAIFADSCEICKKHRLEMNDFVPQIAELINGNAKQKRLYELTVENYLKHLRLEHQVYPAYYQVYLSTSYGFFIGMGIGFILAFSFPKFFHEMWITSTSLGLTISYFIGSRKDMNSRRRKNVI